MIRCAGMLSNRPGLSGRQRRRNRFPPPFFVAETLDAVRLFWVCGPESGLGPVAESEGRGVRAPAFVPVFRAALLLGPAADDLTLYVYAVCSGLGEDAPGQSRLFVVGRIAEVGFGGPYVLGVYEREFANAESGSSCRSSAVSRSAVLRFVAVVIAFPCLVIRFGKMQFFGQRVRLSSELRPDYPIRVATMRRPEARLRNSQR